MKTKTKTFKVSKEFIVGNHSIGWINDRFLKHFKNTKFAERPMPTFQKLPRAMNDVAIESKLKPGFCELGDILTFLDNAPEECKDGYANLFYFSAFVVNVGWVAGRREWNVSAWQRGGGGWVAGSRVFSPATGSQKLSPKTLGHSDSLSLETRVKNLETEVQRLSNWAEQIVIPEL